VSLVPVSVDVVSRNLTPDKTTPCRGQVHLNVRLGYEIRQQSIRLGLGPVESNGTQSLEPLSKMLD
jgi:hypothetical protein